MFLLRTTLLLCILLFCLGSSHGELFNKYGPTATAQSNGNSKQQKRSNWGFWMPEVKFSVPSLKLPWSLSAKAQGDLTVENSTTESPYTTRKEFIVSVKASTAYIYHTTTTQPQDILITSAQIVTSLPQRDIKRPKDELLRKQPQTDRPKPLPDLDPNYDLEFWPPNKASHTEKHPLTAPPTRSTQETPRTTRSYKETTTVTVQNSETKMTEKVTITSTALQSKPSSTPVSMTTLPRLMPSIEKTTVFTSPREDTTQLQNVISTVFMGSTEKALAKTPVTAAGTTVGDFYGIQQTTQAPSKAGGRRMEIPNLLHTPLTTASSVEGLTEEEEHTNTNVYIDLTAKGKDREEYTTITITTLQSTGMPTTEDWPDMTQESPLPDCNAEYSEVCNSSGLWDPAYPRENSNNYTIATTSSNQSQTPVFFPFPPMFVTLYSDWNSAMATWGLAWDAHVYGLGTVFCLISLASTLNLFCLPLCCPSGCGYFALVSLFLLAAGCTRAFALLYDAYGYQDRMLSTKAMLLLYEAPFPCMTAAFGLVFLLLSMRSRMQLSYSAFQRPCFLACLVLLHFAASFGLVSVLRIDQQGTPLCLFLSLISRGAFVALATFLSIAYFVFFCYVRADSKHIYHLNNTSPTPAERYNRCPFAESQDWERAAAAVFLAAIFSLACGGLQLFAMLHAVGLAGRPEVFQPWPWWAFQLSCRVCEAIVCLTLALVVSQPIYCSDHLPLPSSCWMELLATKSPIIPGSYQWTLNQQEKLAICDPVGHGETECLPLYTLVDDRMGSLNGLDLLYHSNRALAYRDLDLHLPEILPNTSALSVGSSCPSDSTADLQPPSPINLSRSIDEALFSESLFPVSLFSPIRPLTSSEHSLDGKDKALGSAQTLKDTHPSDPGLYRTSSCVEMPPQASLTALDQKNATFSPCPSMTSSCCSSPEHWRGSSSSCSLYRPSVAGSSLLLCSSPEEHNPLPSTTSAISVSTDATGADSVNQQRHSRTQSTQESLELPPVLDQSVQEEFLSVCRQIDTVSICSETIDL